MKPKIRQNVSLDPDVFERFCEIAGKKGIKISTWVNQQMVEFIEEEEMRQQMRREKLKKELEGDA